jgi:uncharacterized protein
MKHSLRKSSTLVRRHARKSWHRIRRQTPGRDEILATRWLKPVSPYLSDDRLWTLERQSVARGVAMGLFMGLLMPVAQILFAVAGAAVIRGHVPISAACTLVTNPLTVPPIYYAAYQLGEAMLPRGLNISWLQTDAQHWLAQGLNWAVTHGTPLMAGLLVMASVSAMVGFASVQMLWKKR